MIIRPLLTAFYMIGSRFYGLPWFGTRTIASTIFGLPAGFLTIWIVSLLTPAPPAQLQELVLSRCRLFQPSYGDALGVTANR
jgi:cation/acetate symporter